MHSTYLYLYICIYTNIINTFLYRYIHIHPSIHPIYRVSTGAPERSQMISKWILQVMVVLIPSDLMPPLDS